MTRRLLMVILAALASTAAAAADGAWMVDPRTQCKLWLPREPALGSTIEWSAPCSNAPASGLGIVRLLHNGRQVGGYSGSMKDGRFEGRGILSFTDSFRYDGEWHEGRPHGQGVQVWNNGWRYEGGWRAGMASGSGTLTAPNGAVFAGTWLSGCLRRTPGQLRPPIGVGANDCPRTY